MNYMISMTIIMMTPLMMMSMESWIMMWMMMEMSSISFITLMKMNLSNEGAIVYFLAQSFGSFMILFSIVEDKTTSSLSMMTEKATMMMGMMMKIGIIPFHQWFVMLSKNITMKEMLILFTIQKIPPLILTTWMSNKMMMMMILMLSTMMSMLMQMSQMTMKMMLTYSSIFQTSWMMILSMINMMTTLMYFMIYSITLMMVMNEMKNKSIMNMNNQETKTSTILMLNMVSMSGIPPMLGFMPKWMLFKMMTKEEKMSMIGLMMMIMSVISFFIYFRFLFSTWMKTKMTMTPTKKMTSQILIQMTPPMMMLTMM